MQNLKTFIDQQLIAMKDIKIKKASFIVCLNSMGDVVQEGDTKVSFTVEMN